MRVHSVLQRGHAWDRPTLLSWPAESRSMSLFTYVPNIVVAGVIATLLTMMLAD